MSIEGFDLPTLRRAVDAQAVLKSAPPEDRPQAEQAFRDAINDLATHNASLLWDEAVGMWLEFHLVNTLKWEADEVEELRDVSTYLHVKG